MVEFNQIGYAPREANQFSLLGIYDKKGPNMGISVSYWERKKMCPRPIDNVNCLFSEVLLKFINTSKFKKLTPI